MSIHVVTRRNKGEFVPWLMEHRPDLLPLFKVRGLPGRSLPSATLLVSWLNDPDPALAELEADYADRGIPTVNGNAGLSASRKRIALNVIRDSGIRTARVMTISHRTPYAEIVESVGSPFIVRGDRHNGYTLRVSNERDYSRVRWTQIYPHTPIALEYIDTQSADGLFRKYRYVLVGDRGLMRHKLISPGWNVHSDEAVRCPGHDDEEIGAFAVGCPYHAELNRARLALGLDIVSFDYSVTQDRELVVWEPNPTATIWSPHRGHREHHVRQVSAIWQMHLDYYLARAGL